MMDEAVDGGHLVFEDRVPVRKDQVGSVSPRFIALCHMRWRRRSCDRCTIWSASRGALITASKAAIKANFLAAFLHPA
jgi:hypothetical protein